MAAAVKFNSKKRKKRSGVRELIDPSIYLFSFDLPGNHLELVGAPATIGDLLKNAKLSLPFRANQTFANAEILKSKSYPKRPPSG